MRLSGRPSSRPLRSRPRVGGTLAAAVRAEPGRSTLASPALRDLPAATLALPLRDRYAVRILGDRLQHPLTPRRRPALPCPLPALHGRAERLRPPAAFPRVRGLHRGGERPRPRILEAHPLPACAGEPVQQHTRRPAHSAPRKVARRLSHPRPLRAAPVHGPAAAHPRRRLQPSARGHRGAGTGRGAISPRGAPLTPAGLDRAGEHPARGQVNAPAPGPPTPQTPERRKQRPRRW